MPKTTITVRTKTGIDILPFHAMTLLKFLLEHRVRWVAEVADPNELPLPDMEADDWDEPWKHSYSEGNSYDLRTTLRCDVILVGDDYRTYLGDEAEQIMAEMAGVSQDTLEYDLPEPEFGQIYDKNVTFRRVNKDGSIGEIFTTKSSNRATGPSPDDDLPF